MATVCITGSTGFIGKNLLRALINFTGHKLILPVRETKAFESSSEVTVFPDLSDITEDYFSMNACDVVVHLAARAHVTKEYVSDPLREFRRVNCDLTLDLAKKAAKAGVKRFIFLSSIGVNGVSNRSPFKITDKPAPVEYYAVSKLEAEIGLLDIAKTTGLEVVIIRPPLVYGPNAPGNFGKLVKLVNSRVPLPLGGIHNKRSMVSVDNLTDFIMQCIEHPKANGQIFFVSDDQDISTAELVKLMAKRVDNPPFILPVPEVLLKTLGFITCQRSTVGRLCDSLQVDISHTKQTLGWVPVISLEEGIRRCFRK